MYDNQHSVPDPLVRRLEGALALAIISVFPSDHKADAQVGVWYVSLLQDPPSPGCARRWVPTTITCDFAEV